MMITMFYKEVEKVKTRLFKWTLAILVLFSIFQSVNSVKADDDEYEEYETHDKDREEHDDDDGDNEEYRGYDNDDEKYEEYDQEMIGNLKYETSLSVKVFSSHFGIFGQGIQDLV